MLCYASAVYAMVLCLAVRPSQFGVLLKRPNRSSWCFLAQTLFLAYSTLHCNGIRVICKNKGTSFCDIVPNSELKRFSPRHVNHRKRCQLRATDDRRQFITLSVRFCLQHYGRDAQPRRAESLATAEACPINWLTDWLIDWCICWKNFSPLMTVPPSPILTRLIQPLQRWQCYLYRHSCRRSTWTSGSLCSYHRLPVVLPSYS